jgi:hypothetical protein
MASEKDFTILFHAKNRQEMELGKQLLEEAGIPVVIGASDRVEMLEVLQGSSAEGQLTIAVPIDRFDEATGLIEDAWGPEALADR